MAHDVHLMLTKFNVALAGPVEDRPGLDARWLEQRLELFTCWTVPSVRRQTAPPSGWLVFVDEATPDSYLSRLAEATGDIVTIVPVAGRLSDSAISEHVQQRLSASVDTLVTSRLDSDDAIAADYAELVLAQSRDWRGFLNSPHGLQYCDGIILRRWDFRGPFLSMVEDLAPGHAPRTAFSVEHYLANSVAPVRQLGGRPAWIQVVHGENLANQMSGVPYPRGRAERALGWSPPPGPAGPRVGVLARALVSEGRWAGLGLAQRLGLTRHRGLRT